MSDLDLEVKESGGKEKWLEQTKHDLEDLKDYLKYLENQAYKEVGNGGNFDSKEEVDETILDTKNIITELTSKMQIIRRSIDGNADTHQLDESVEAKGELILKKVEPYYIVGFRHYQSGDGWFYNESDTTTKYSRYPTHMFDKPE